MQALCGRRILQRIGGRVQRMSGGQLLRRGECGLHGLRSGHLLGANVGNVRAVLSWRIRESFIRRVQHLPGRQLFLRCGEQLYQVRGRQLRLRDVRRVRALPGRPLLDGGRLDVCHVPGGHRVAARGVGVLALRHGQLLLPR